MKVYVATSWRNKYQAVVVHALRYANHVVYDFRNPSPGDQGFHWSDIDPAWESWTSREYREHLAHPLARLGFCLDMDALKWCEAVVAVQPFGRSASLELGWACGAGKLTLLLLSKGEPELMVKMCDHICLDLDEVLEALPPDPKGID